MNYIKQQRAQMFIIFMNQTNNIFVTAQYLCILLQSVSIINLVNSFN